ncbi:MAG: HEAT repeat domain-containing protein [Candidatus Saganbacteria bacterium]|nr:HEAT repeat domain-containing protein [Candidatus Saganbacteria bacterium]
MTLLKDLENNKGAVSSALGKLLAEKVLKGNNEILKEAIQLVSCENKNVRAGAAKIIEKVAEKKPELVAPSLKKLLPSLCSPEPQTRWMIINAFGLTAKLNPLVAVKAFDKAKEFLSQNSGTCLWDRTICYLGYLGALSTRQAREVFPVLEKALKNIPNQSKTVLDGFIRMADVLDEAMKKKALSYANEYSNSAKSSVKSSAKKLAKKLK